MSREKPKPTNEDLGICPCHCHCGPSCEPKTCPCADCRKARGEKPMKSRCPACNPLHGGGPTSRFMHHHSTGDRAPKVGRGRGRGVKLSPCGLCRGSRLVPVETSRRYVDALRSQEEVSE